MITSMDPDSNEDELAHQCTAVKSTRTPIPQKLGDQDAQQINGNNPTVTPNSSSSISVDTGDGNSTQDSESQPQLLRLPSELLHQILSYLSARDLACVSATCRTLADHGSNDLLWVDLVNANLPLKIEDSGPYDSFRRLYAAHHPCWFLPRSKIWFSDTEHTGNLILARYDNRRGVIEAYRVLADSHNHQFQVWDWDPDVIIMTFKPRISLWLDDPVVLLKGNPSTFPSRSQYLHREIRMPMAVESQHVFNAFSLCSKEIPSNLVIRPDRQWPPLKIPSGNRVYRDVEHHWSQWENPPKHVSQVCESAFRVRRWAHFRLGLPILTAGSSETLTTYATLDPDLYTPTREKPYQGIWVGDYPSHGCEFLLFLQRDSESDSGSTTASSRASFEHPETEMSGETSAAFGQDIIEQGSLQAIKLTGDPNVPRGEISFIAEDIGPNGLIRVADEAPFKGARIVRGRGHVAGFGFRDGKLSRKNSYPPTAN